MSESIFYPHWQQPHNVSKATFFACYTLLILTMWFALVISSHIFHCCLVPRPCPILLLSIDCSLPDSSIHEISQAEIIEWVAISFSRGSSQLRDQTCILCSGKRILHHQAFRKAPKNVLLYLCVKSQWIN